MNLKAFKILPLLLISFVSVSGQSVLTLEEAIKVALENNYAIRLVKNEIEIAKNNNSVANAGFLPTVTAQGGYESNSANTRQQFFDGRLREAVGAKSNSLTGSVLLNWTIFQGFDMFISKETLERLQNMEELEARLTIENTVSSVIIGYYNIIAEKQRADVLLDALQLSRERKDLAEFKLNIGAASNTDVFQASVDFNADTAAYIQQVRLIKALKGDFNELLSREPSTDFQVTDSIAIDRVLNFEELQERVKRENTRLFLARNGVTLAELNAKLWKSQYYPSISLYGGYSYLRSESQVGLLESNLNNGTVYGIRGTFNILNGFNTRRNVQNARILKESSQINQEQTQLNVANEFYQLYLEYQANLDLAQLESGNLQIAESNLEIAVEKFRIGAISNIELRDIQVKLIDAQTRYIRALFLVKASETELLRLAGEFS